MSHTLSPEESEQAERRRSRRIPLDAVVHYQIDGSEFINLSSNISADGIFIKNFSPPPIGSGLKIRVQLPAELGGVAVRLLGNVVRVVDGVGVAERGMGVEFHTVEADTQEAVRHFVREVYEIDQLERIEQVDGEGSFRYTPAPQDLLRLQPDGRDEAGSQLDPFDRPRRRLLWGILLLLTGALVGGGLAMVFLLGH